MSWEGNLLFHAGKSVLIKVVAQAISSFVMSYFYLSKALVNDMNTMVTMFWWGDMENNNCIHQKAWTDMCVSKFEGFRFSRFGGF